MFWPFTQRPYQAFVSTGVSVNPNTQLTSFYRDSIHIKDLHIQLTTDFFLGQGAQFESALFIELVKLLHGDDLIPSAVKTV